MGKEIKIAKIISTTELVINAGSKQNINVGDKFQIIDKVGSEPVMDPDTGKSLGTLDIIKGMVEVTAVYPNMSIVQSERNINHLLQSSMGVTQSLTSYQVRKDLNVDKSQITGGAPQNENVPIRIGDIAIPMK
nr:FlgT C-terminal domain-containing protein [uncultured Ligilactobacillus sp.]